jgi:hypothetical protein
MRLLVPPPFRGQGATPSSARRLPPLGRLPQWSSAAAHVYTSTTGRLRFNNMVVNGIACPPTTYTRLAALPSATTDVGLPALTWAAAHDIDDGLPTLLESATALRLEKLPLPGIVVSPFCDTPTRSSLPYAPSPRLHVFRSVPHLSPRGPTATATTAATRLLHVRKMTSSSATLHEPPPAPASQRKPQFHTTTCHTASASHTHGPPHPLPCSPQHLSNQIKVTLRLTVSQSVCLGVVTHLGHMTRNLFVYFNFEKVTVLSMGRPL